MQLGILGVDVIISPSSRAEPQSIFHYTPQMSVAMIIRPDLKPIVAFTNSVIFRSRVLIAQSKKVLAKSQKIIDDETAKQFEVSARLKHKKPHTD